MTPEEQIAAILLGEAAGEQESDGMAFVRDVMVNRARKSGKSLEQVATAPKQFSAYTRPDLSAFVAKQPWELQEYAKMLVREAMNPRYEPAYPGVEHYVAKSFWDSRAKLSPKHWVHSMEPAMTVGNHVALKPKKQ